MRKILAVVMVTVFACCGLVVSGEAASTELIVNTSFPPSNYQTQGLEELSKRVRERTNGEVEMIVEPGGALGYTGPDILKAVRDGLLPVSEFIISYCEGDERLFGIYALPFMLDGFKEALVFHEVSLPYFERACEKWNQKILYLAPWPFAGLWTKRPITSVSDMKGLKIRTYDKNGALFMEAVGATPLALPFTEVYTSLNTNLIDSVLTSTQTAVDVNFWEVLQYYQPVRMTTTVSIVTINLDYFNDMTPEQQKILLDTSKEIEKEMWAKGEEIDVIQEKFCNDNGIETVPVSDEFKAELKVVADKIIKDWLATSEEGTKIYNEFQAALKNR